MQPFSLLPDMYRGHCSREQPPLNKSRWFACGETNSLAKASFSPLGRFVGHTSRHDDQASSESWHWTAYTRSPRSATDRRFEWRRRMVLVYLQPPRGRICGWLSQSFYPARRCWMQPYALTVIWCVIVLTGIMIYIPIMYVRKTDKILKALQQIEVNTRKAIEGKI